MRSIIISFLFLSFILLVFGCKKETFNLNEEISLDFNKSAFVKIDGEEYEIKFKKLEEDSRCKPDVHCFWAGQVAVTINLNNKTDFTIGHHTTILPTAEYKNHTIRLLEVNYNKKKNYGKEKHCSIKLRID